VRREAIRLLGIVGALDPFKHNQNQMARQKVCSRKFLSTSAAEPFHFTRSGDARVG
jgi:hypothetical protein